LRTAQEALKEKILRADERGDIRGIPLASSPVGESQLFVVVNAHCSRRGFFKLCYQVTRSRPEKLIVDPSCKATMPAASWDSVIMPLVISVEMIDPEVMDTVQSTP
jgi:hypothetical protein